MRTVGTVLLALGFLALTTAVLIRDPTALDANIGAGILSLTGIPTGAVGLGLLLVEQRGRSAARRRTPSLRTRS